MTAIQSPELCFTFVTHIFNTIRKKVLALHTVAVVYTVSKPFNTETHNNYKISPNYSTFKCKEDNSLFVPF